MTTQQKRKRILFLGTPEFAVASLERLLQDSRFEVVAVVSQPDRPAGRKMQLRPSPVKVLALEKNIEVVTPLSVNTPEFLEKLKIWNAESAAVVAFGQILSQNFLNAFPLGCVNVHASLLPRWRGAAPIQRALMAGDAETGVALQKVVRKLDAGDVLGERRLVLTDEYEAQRLHDELRVLGADLLVNEYFEYLEGRQNGVVQDEAKVTVAPKIDKAEARVDWHRSAREVFNHIRGLTMGPVCFTTRAQVPRTQEQKDNQAATFKIHRNRPLENYVRLENTRPGTVVEIRDHSVVVACLSGALEIFEVQPESRAKMAVPEYLRGYALAKGEVLG